MNSMVKKKKKSTKLWHWVCLITNKYCYIKDFSGKILKSNYFGTLIQCFPNTTLNKSYTEFQGFNLTKLF